jgi:Fe-S cluster biogenesis protein NfuA/nitrite reductase/ring-hydroxylating ferredoxin subunit
VDFDAAVAALGTLVDTLERDGDERALMLLDLVDAVHRPAIERLAAGDVGDPAAQAVLAMYGLVDVDPEVLVEEALDAVRPYIESHGGHVELLRVEGGDIHLRLGGACNGCAGSTVTLTRGIEEALRDHVPGFERIVAHTPATAAPELLQIQLVRPGGAAGARLPRPVFAAVGRASTFPPGSLKTVEADGVAVLLANVDGELYALRDGCSVDGRTLEGGRLTGAIVVCPWHNCAYDVRSGKRVDDEAGARGLPVVPVAVQEGELRVAVNVA